MISCIVLRKLIVKHFDSNNVILITPNAATREGEQITYLQKIVRLRYSEESLGSFVFRAHMWLFNMWSRWGERERFDAAAPGAGKSLNFPLSDPSTLCIYAALWRTRTYILLLCMQPAPGRSQNAHSLSPMSHSRQPLAKLSNHQSIRSKTQFLDTHI